MAVRKRGNAFESRVMYQGKTYYKSHGPVSRTVAKEKDAQFKASLPIPMKSPCDSESFRQSEPNHCATPIVGAERRYDYVIFQSLSC
jgi:hypothetical protein